MRNPLQPLFDRCSRGFTMPQKIGITVGVFLYVICPLDFDVIPVIGWIDDIVLLALLRSVWTSPTLPLPTGAAAVVRAERPRSLFCR